MPASTTTSIVKIAPFSPARQIRTDKHVVYLDPRISATKLAEYVVADPSRQETIARNAKKAPIMLTAPYSRVRSALPSAFSHAGLGADALRQSADIEIQPQDNEWTQNEKKRSSIALMKLAEIAPSIECSNARIIHRPEGGWGNLMLGKTRVSVQPELVFSTLHRGILKVGAMILNTGQGESLSLARHNGKYSVGDYLTAMVVRFLGERLKDMGPPLITKCFAIDIHRGEIHTAPKSHKTLNNHMEAACRTLAALWDGLPGIEGGLESDSDESEF